MQEWVLTPDRYLSKEELGKLLRKAEELRTLGIAKKQKQPIRDWLIIRLSILSGFRASEICGLKIADCYIGYSRSELLVRRGKGGKTRLVRIGADLKRDLRWVLRWKAENGELHPEAFLIRSQRSERLTPSAIWRRWKMHCPLHRLHDARHTFATLLYQSSNDLRLVQKQLGHSRPSITAVYADVCDEKARESLKAMDQLTRIAARVKNDEISIPAVESPGRLCAQVV